jgi:uncharacterized CHY-type Zn-finger protein
MLLHVFAMMEVISQREIVERFFSFFQKKNEKKKNFFDQFSLKDTNKHLVMCLMTLRVESNNYSVTKSDFKSLFFGVVPVLSFKKTLAKKTGSVKHDHFPKYF